MPTYKLICMIEMSMEIDVKFLECDYLLVQRCVKLTLAAQKELPDSISIHHLFGLETLQCIIKLFV